MTSPTKPVQRFRLGSIRLAVWENRDRKGRSYYTTSIGRSYRDEKGQWTDAGSLRPSDLPVVRDLSAQALEWITAHPPQAEGESNQDIEPEPGSYANLLHLLQSLERQLVH